MYYFYCVGDLDGDFDVVDVLPATDHAAGPTSSIQVSRAQIKTKAWGEKLLAKVREFTKTDFILTEDSGYPKFDIVRAPQVGDFVSRGYNGDHYPDSEIVRISPTGKVITTASGKKYYGSREIGKWKSGAFSLMRGYHDRRNPCF